MAQFDAVYMMLTMVDTSRAACGFIGFFCAADNFLTQGRCRDQPAENRSALGSGTIGRSPS
jgi:hypothetical protein